MIEKKISYFIAYYGKKSPLAWCREQKRFIPYGMDLYVTFFEDLNECMREMRKVRRSCSGWVNDIYIDSKIVYSCR